MIISQHEILTFLADKESNKVEDYSMEPYYQAITMHDKNTGVSAGYFKFLEPEENVVFYGDLNVSIVNGTAEARYISCDMYADIQQPTDLEALDKYFCDFKTSISLLEASGFGLPEYESRQDDRTVFTRKVNVRNNPGAYVKVSFYGYKIKKLN